MNKRMEIRRWMSVVMFAAALVTMILSLTLGNRSSDLESAAQDMGVKMEKRMALLDKYVSQALHSNPNTWMDLKGLPEDMVVYRYVDDSLQSWAHQFPLRNDDIRPVTLVQRLGDARDNLSSPLSDVTEKLIYANHGPKWYLEKAVQGDGCKVIAGLEVVNELQAGSLNGINRHFRQDARYTIRPISASVGVPVLVGGEPLMKLSAETMSEPYQQHSALTWLAVAFLLGASLLFLSARPSLVSLAAILCVQMTLLCWLYYYGRNLSQVSQLFTPLLYADGHFLYSLGAVVLVNLALTLFVLDLYLVRWTLLKALRRGNSLWMQGALALFGLILVGCICAYIHITFKSIQYNSNITLELYKVGLLSRHTALVYISFLGLTLTVPLLLQMSSPLVRSLVGIRYDVFSVRGRILYAVAVGVYFVMASSTMGFRKEQQRVDVWANRLAMDRDIGLEIQLRSVETSIAADGVIGALSILDDGQDILRSRLVSTYMARISQDYDIMVVQPRLDAGASALFQERIRSGKQLGDNSHFFYSAIGSGRVSYTGLFTYYVKGYGSSTILVTVESKHNREDRGYLSLLGIADPGRVSLPPVYSWAKYAEERLVQYKGAFAYPTVLEGPLRRDSGHVEANGWTHFVLNVSDEEVVVISRPSTEKLYYVVEAFLFAILAFLLISALTWRLKQKRSGGRRYYQARISMVVYISLIMTLIAMAVFSVWFVYKRNNADMQSIMTSRINMLQSMLQETMRMVDKPAEASSPAVLHSVETVGNNLKCDITLFDVSGRVIMSTTPEVYDRMILGHRLNDAAYKHITYGHERFYVNQERTGRRRYYALYAPVMNSTGRMVAIASSPFTDLTHDLQTEAILHVTTVIVIFLLLLLIARFVTFEMVSRMFAPIVQLRRKMTVSDVDHLEPLEYNQDDEITPLVQAYNRMVHDLGESSRRLAQVERDKAWTDMARRVAHDLKNPLTPIKLQLQMLMRMKSSGNPAWEERFDEVAATVLYHVDLLADSADQFSTFAKMYDQSPERLNLDTLVKQEVELFDSRDDLRLDYFGLADAWVSAPRPQLTRVVVNLITNAIQAVDEVQGEKRLVVSVRNSVEDGFYDIVVEDNGPGVSEDNQSHIFTPDFTTKTSGSGLGLAICKRIVEHCGGTISYSRSFTLGGACFTVKYPKY